MPNHIHPGFCRMLLCALVLLGTTLLLPAETVASKKPAQLVRIRFVDSTTGYAVKPDSVEATPSLGKQKPLRVRRNGVKRDGQTTLTLDQGQHTIKVTAPGYQPMAGEFVVLPDNPYNIVFQLDPLALPREIQPEAVAKLHQINQTVFLGFVVDEESGQPLTNVLVRTEPSGSETHSDTRGYFQIYVPVQTLAAATNSPARLIFTAPGFRSEERTYLELWSEGDWIYRIRLDRGEGIKTVDERTLRRRSEYPVATLETTPSTNPPAIAVEAATEVVAENVITQAIISGEFGVTPKLSTIVPVRIPTNIRVLRQDTVTIDYISLQTYCQRSLASEVYASWGNYSGGSNSLQAVAVAIRTYAIGFINNPYNANYDICGTTTCQAYNHTANSSQTTAAVNNTVNYAMIQPGATRIGFKITEYSAENNSLGFSCGDGFTQPTGGCIADPVCSGEDRYGHGRGMCQWGTVKWATGLKFPGNNFSNTTMTNGQPKRDWMWICEHYYPNLQLVQGAPLTLNDYVQVQGTANLAVRQCADGSISTGTNCPLVTTKASGAHGIIIAGPVRVTSDGVGYTWWRVQWFDANATIGWVPENWLERTAEPLNVPPVLAPIANVTSPEGSFFSFTNTTTASANAEVLLTDFESFVDGTSAGTVMFRAPNFSGSTAAFLEAAPNTTTVTSGFPAGNDGARALRASWSWTNTANLWLRLTTSGTANLPNPVLDVTRKLKFDLYSDRNIGVALAVRETGNAAGTAIGSNGGTAPGIIEFAGVTNVVSGQPQVTRIVNASNWMTLTFDFPNEPIRNFVGGNGVLSTATGLGVLEHLAFVPAAGSGAYNVYLDNFIVTTPKVLTYSLSNAPAGATINPASGVFTWTPTEAQGPGVYNITVRVTDNNLPPASDAKIFQVTVTESNQAPVLAPITNRIVHAGTLITFTNSATDADVPANVLSFALEPGAPALAMIEATNGIFNWQTSEAEAGTTNSITVRVSDAGVPPLSDTKSFAVAVLARPLIQTAEISGGNFVMIWSAIPGQKYRVQYKDNLNDLAWNDLGPEVTATLTTATMSDPPGVTQRFYRVQVVNP
jgi:hypothetical protein